MRTVAFIALCGAVCLFFWILYIATEVDDARTDSGCVIPDKFEPEEM